MHFTINAQRYIVTIASRPIVLDGDLCRAKIDHRHGRILICGKLPRHERRRELFHELTHAWRQRRGQPKSEEQDAIESSEMMDFVLAKYLQQGGDAVLESMDPPADAPSNPNPSGPMSRSSAECGYCHAQTAVGSIGNDSPEWSQDTGSWTMGRGILCMICDRVTLWRETCSAEGMPTGFIVPHPAPRVVSGGEAVEWLSRHGQVCQVCALD